MAQDAAHTLPLLLQDLKDLRKHIDDSVMKLAEAHDAAFRQHGYYDERTQKAAKRTHDFINSTLFIADSLDRLLRKYG